MTPQTLRLVIYDCDGVLVDSETPSNRAVAQEVTKLGWPMTTAESMARFVGHSLPDIMVVAEAHLGRPAPPGWAGMLRDRIVDVMVHEAEPIPGAADALHATMALGLPFRVASNSSHAEMRAKFGRTGLDRLVQGRVHSVEDVAASKPAPDVFLAAAAAEGVPPGACLVIEDSLPGVRGAMAAGMTCIGFDPHGDGAALRALGAHPVRSLDELPALFRAAMRLAA